MILIPTYSNPYLSPICRVNILSCQFSAGMHRNSQTRLTRCHHKGCSTYSDLGLSTCLTTCFTKKGGNMIHARTRKLMKERIQPFQSRLKIMKTEPALQVPNTWQTIYTYTHIFFICLSPKYISDILSCPILVCGHGHETAHFVA